MVHPETIGRGLFFQLFDDGATLFKLTEGGDVYPEGFVFWVVVLRKAVFDCFENVFSAIYPQFGFFVAEYCGCVDADFVEA